ncbi:NAD(P)H-dependent oxidoreductase [Pseudomonas sp. 21LCFQ010]|uniref:NADPH-dependent FMN reductase n=1 Tax=Pseudomonas sp. 21LCFQ010 TaxID=2957506 RepID=UPI002097D573|nr:NADPH-dependent FMN reductase [Pseudomonas sp. 21LCFQ010]MCO8165086.1 NAD(P)H-dependent oxidoreductase [Pseudomonas sp. 21LCFQ010]
MSQVHRIAVLVGSLRKESINRKIALALAGLAPSSLELKIVEIGDLPLYNEDIDGANPPAAYTRFRDELAAADGLLFVTPEYNRSVPGALKNAIDVGSRPYGQSKMSGKPGAVISASPGAIGGFGANHHLRQSLVFLDVATLQQPESYLGNIGASFDENGELNERTTAFLKTFIETFAAWVEKTRKF